MVGKRFRQAFRLAVLALQNWSQIDGYAVDQGLNPLGLAEHRYFNWVYYLFTRNLSDEDREQFDIQLDMPLPWEDSKMVSETEAEIEEAGFLALYTQVTGGRGVQDLNK